MTNKSKQRVRLRMTRTGETYQAVLNAQKSGRNEATHGPGDERPRPRFVLPCDVCGEDIIDDPSDAMLQWFCEAEAPYKHVAALFFHHRGECDDLVQNAARAHGVSARWHPLGSLVDKDWYRESLSLGGLYVWSEVHEARLEDFFSRVAFQRESGWRPPASGGHTLPNPPGEKRSEAIAKLGGNMARQLRLGFAPEWLDGRARS